MKIDQASVLSAPQGSTIPWDPPLIKSCNQGWAMQHDCIIAWKMQLQLAGMAWRHSLPQGTE